MASAALPTAAASAASAAPKTRERMARPVEPEGEQRRSLVAGEPEVLPVLGGQEGELPVGRRLVQPAARLVRALVALIAR